MLANSLVPGSWTYAMLWIKLASAYGQGHNFAFAIVKSEVKGGTYNKENMLWNMHLD